MMFEKWCKMKNNLYPGDETLLLMDIFYINKQKEIVSLV